MEQKTFQTFYNDEWLADTLMSMGYGLTDNGDHWRSSATYRGGGNHSSIVIYKKTGVWRDFALDEDFQPFQALVEKTVGTSLASQILESKQTYDQESQVRKSTLIKMEKIYAEETLKRLLPHFDFYTKRKISPALLKKLRCGYAGGYEMYQRLVFPIYNKDSRIHGWSGRHTFWKEGDNKPKWKHMGNTKEWVYPLYLPELPECEKSILETKTVYLVESVGDAMALMENGIFNVLVMFTTSINKKTISEIIRLGVETIYISTNRDEGEEAGQLGAAKVALSLLEHFAPANIRILFPTKNDIHAMMMFGDDVKAWAASEGITDILEFVESRKEHLSKKRLDQIKKMKKLYGK